MIRSWSLLAVVLLVSCTKTSSKYCGLHPEDTATCPTPDAAVTTCTTSDDCTATPETLVCNATSGTCVECDQASSQTAACTGTDPVCGDDQVCRGCRAHAECASGACLPDGSCGTDETVAFVDGSAPGTSASCTQAAPCRRISEGLVAGPPRLFIKVSNTVVENLSINDRNITILASPGARLASTQNTILQVSGSSRVVIHDLEIGATVASPTLGVDVNASTGSLTLHHVRVINNSTAGIRANAGTLNVYRSTIADNLGGGIHVRNSAAGYDIRNNFIHSNGRGSTSNATLYGGLLLEQVVGRAEYNTVAFNECDGLQNRAGIACYGLSSSATGNIVFGNREGFVALDSTQASGNCTFGTTLKLGMGDLGFANPNPTSPDLHLTVASPSSVRDAGGACEATNPEDIDGNPRPYGLGCDLGADELTP
ncbi:MAG: hypothetical protein JWP01_2013 [Myxococcales bacterium]|nr:hypothetical protein [Myxococcales bacterium]